MDNMHTHQFKETIVPSTCKENGYTLYTCDCGYEHKTNFMPLVQHSFQILEETPATCTVPGSKTAVCTVCGETHEQVIPPLGHDHDKWIIQTYPTCQTPGSQIRKCNRCEAIEEQQLAPTVHRIAPGTERYFKGKLVDFFCQNCGQTICCTPANSSVEKKSANYTAIKIILLAAGIAVFFNYILTIIAGMQPNLVYTFPWITYTVPIMTMSWIVLAFLFVRKIKDSRNYTRWLGIPMLIYATNFTITTLWSMLVYIYSFYDIITSCNNLLWIFIYLLLAIMFLRGTEKKSWVFFVVLSHIIVWGSFSFISTISYFEFAGYYNSWFALENTFSVLSSGLQWAALLLLIAPNKNKAAGEQVDIP